MKAFGQSVHAPFPAKKDIFDPCVDDASTITGLVPLSKTDSGWKPPLQGDNLAWKRRNPFHAMSPGNERGLK
jgi:hypothetical protein